jgi:sugar phosphate isomerase/epimerase
MRSATTQRARCNRAKVRIRVSSTAYQFIGRLGRRGAGDRHGGRPGAPISSRSRFDPDLARFTPLFTYCAAARNAGIRVALEFLPYSGVRNIDDAMRVVTDSGASNAGVLLDALHLDRSGATVADIARIPPERITFAQLCDARKWVGPRTDELLVTEARTARLPAGTGDLPLYEFLDALPPGIEIEYEVARADLSQKSALEGAGRGRMPRFMRAYEAHRRDVRAALAAGRA